MRRGTFLFGPMRGPADDRGTGSYERYHRCRHRLAHGDGAGATRQSTSRGTLAGDPSRSNVSPTSNLMSWPQHSLAQMALIRRCGVRCVIRSHCSRCAISQPLCCRVPGRPAVVGTSWMRSRRLPRSVRRPKPNDIPPTHRRPEYCQRPLYYCRLYAGINADGILSRRRCIDWAVFRW